MKPSTRKLLINLVIPGILPTAIILLLPKIYSSIEQLKPVIDTIGIEDTLAIIEDDTVFTRNDTIIDKGLTSFSEHLAH